MGQKGNILSIKKSNYPLGSLISNPKLFIFGFSFLNIVEKVLLKKNIVVAEKSVNFSNNQNFLNLKLFFKTAKLTKYKRQKTFLVSKKLSPSFHSLTAFISKQFYLFNHSSSFWNIKILNSSLKRSLTAFFYNKTKHFLKILFVRRFSLFMDFVKLTSLYSLNLINAKVYLSILAQIFKTLQKKRHSRFLLFLKLVFKLLLQNQAFFSTFSPTSSPITGIKFLVSGKIGGKARSRSSCLLVGSVPIQSVSKNVSFSKQHIYTVYGVFGFKLWVCRTNN